MIVSDIEDTKLNEDKGCNCKKIKINRISSFISIGLRHAEIRVQGYTKVFNRRHKWDIGISDVNDRQQRMWTDILFESMIMASVLLSFS